MNEKSGSLPPRPKQKGTTQQPGRSESDFHKLMSDFDSLVGAAANGKLAMLPPGLHATTASSSPSPAHDSGAVTTDLDLAHGSPSTFVSVPRSLSRGLSTPGGLSSAFDSSFFRGGQFSALAKASGTPNSRDSSCSTSSQTTSEGRLGIRLAPVEGVCGSSGFVPEDGVDGGDSGAHDCTTLPPSATGASREHRSLLGLLTAKLRRQPLLPPVRDVSPRPHSVPVDSPPMEVQRTSAGGESLTLSHGDVLMGRGRPATTGERVDGIVGAGVTATTSTSTGVTGPNARGRSAVLRDDSASGSALDAGDTWADQKSALDRELEEIERLRQKREKDRQQRDDERRERRLKRESDGLPSSPSSVTTTANALREPTLEEEHGRLLKLIAVDMELLMETEAAAREAMCAREDNAFATVSREGAFEREKIALRDEAVHQTRLRRIAEEASKADRHRAERERQRRWEAVRDTVVDEEQERLFTCDTEQTAFDALLDAFYEIIRSPWFDVMVEERLTRTERWEAWEREAFEELTHRFVAELESVQRRRIERAYASLTSSTLAVPILTYNFLSAAVVMEREKRRHIVVAQEIAHGVHWQQFCEEVHPLIDRNLWLLINQEASARAIVERDESDGAATSYHGCASSRELVSRYALVVRQLKERRAEAKAEAIEDILEDELAERIFSERDEREHWILIEELWRRGIDTIRANEKKRHIAEAMKAAEALRVAEIQRLQLEEERQKREREAANERRKSVSATSSSGGGTVRARVSSPSTTGSVSKRTPPTPPASANHHSVGSSTKPAPK